MKIIPRQNNSYIIHLNTGELTILNNALNEVCNGLDVPEFSTRMGAEPEEVQGLLQQINSALENEQSE